MKKLFLGLAVVASSLTFAQQFGVKGGMNVSSISNSNSNSKVGFYGGLFANFPVATSFSIQPEVLYNDLGAKTSSPTTTLNEDYIAVPVMFQYLATPKFYAEAGPEFGFLMSAKTKFSGNSIDVKSSLNTFNFGIGIGVGYYFTPEIGVTARYVAGMTDIVKNNSGTAEKNNAFQLGLAYKFGK